MSEEDDAPLLNLASSKIKEGEDEKMNEKAEVKRNASNRSSKLGHTSNASNATNPG